MTYLVTGTVGITNPSTSGMCVVWSFFAVTYRSTDKSERHIPSWSVYGRALGLVGMVGEMWRWNPFALNIRARWWADARGRAA